MLDTFIRIQVNTADHFYNDIPYTFLCCYVIHSISFNLEFIRIIYNLLVLDLILKYLKISGCDFLIDRSSNAKLL